MKADKLLAEISRKFMKEQKVIRYRLKKISEMDDGEIISACHFYCEENRLVDEWLAYREELEKKMEQF